MFCVLYVTTIVKYIWWLHLVYTGTQDGTIQLWIFCLIKRQNLGIIYSLIAFDERVTFWLQRVWSLPCACAYVALFARRLAYNHYAITHAYNAANTHAQGSDPARWSQKVNSLVESNRSIVYQGFSFRVLMRGGGGHIVVETFHIQSMHYLSPYTGRDEVKRGT